MNIKILGPGCPKCKTLEKVTRDAVAETGIDSTVEKVEDIVKIMAYNVMHTPVLVINEKVVLSGQVPTVNQVKEILLKNQ
ncbi:MAG: redox-active disulfide protein 2 [Bacteroidetes bacterium GWE2_41_25]|nr:MAG: redox-active disulfide protein 2 [Bacteroidetes bacterium GWA2_40_15]OFX94499.1 MAG: redox-active disulfide protein 2 [Bacteroidetes bacterium GWC2_40_22]OFY11107.1 MAG: redox-active disulfide protein 2 [Bacteroidetes bacterium GWE2_41_25]OFY58810.1 MAG: redox-active disulfide protein 2 [Bacteroidetes bacterium GWF2_41_9]HBH83962.1 thioredoxin family protein [Bacteroidales bacterium]